VSCADPIFNYALLLEIIIINYFTMMETIVPGCATGATAIDIDFAPGAHPVFNYFCPLGKN
jgi:hypothetical protein